MTKPISKFAVAVWVLAGVLVLGDLLYVYAFSHTSLAFTAQPGAFYVVIVNIWVSLRGPILNGAQLLALGALIELVDRIRWNASMRDRQISN